MRPVRAYPFTDGPASGLDPGFAPLRETAPVSWVRLPYGDPCWLVTRYDDVRQVITDSRFSRAAACTPGVARMTPEPGSAESLFMMDPPEHTRLRRLTAQAFSIRRIGGLRPRVAGLVGELLTDMEALDRTADLVQHLALPLPILVICELLGVPFSDRTLFRRWVDPILSSTAYSPAQVREALDQFSDYVCDLLDERRARPAADLLSALIQAHDEDGRLSELELVTFAGTLLVAGHENTANQIANSVFSLLRAPPQWSRLCSGAAPLEDAVEELLRYAAVGSGVSFARVATEDVTLSGTVIRKGEPVVVSLPAANRDPRRFTDPETLDVTRQDNPHLAFGPGLHHCVGATLARLELRETLGALVHRWPRLRLAVPVEEVVWKSGLLAHAPVELPVAW
jgi:nocardicin N-oxygenase